MWTSGSNFFKIFHALEIFLFLIFLFNIYNSHILDGEMSQLNSAFLTGTVFAPHYFFRENLYFDA